MRMQLGKVKVKNFELTDATLDSYGVILRSAGVNIHTIACAYAENSVEDRENLKL